MGAAIGHAGNDSAAGEALGVYGEHSCCHGAAGGKANDVATGQTVRFRNIT
jgi:hypothetical protein